MSPSVLPMPSGGMSVYLVDDEPAVRAALSFLLRSRGLQVLAFESGEALLAALEAWGQVPPGCFVLDVRMRGMSGLAVHDALIARQLRHPVMFLSGHGDIPMVVEALKKGAFDFLEKPHSDNALVDRISQALAVAAAMHEDAARDAEVRARLASITPRERDVMRMVAAGRLNKQIAAELNLAMRTVEVYRARVFAKLELRSAAELGALLAQYPEE
ncbi:MAG: response regulator [Burkholderiaceae bacterium]